MFLELSELVYLPGRSDVCTRAMFPRFNKNLIILKVLKMTVVEAIAMDGRSRHTLVTFKNVGKGTPGGGRRGGRGGEHGRALQAAWNRIMILVCFYWWNICIGARSALVQSFVLAWDTHIQ